MKKTNRCSNPVCFICDNPELYEPLEDALKWKCECGAVCDPMDGCWRWNGSAWEHWHSPEIGHVMASKDKKD